MENVQANIRDVEGLNIVCIEPVDRLSIFCSETVKRARAKDWPVFCILEELSCDR